YWMNEEGLASGSDDDLAFDQMIVIAGEADNQTVDANTCEIKLPGGSTRTYDLANAQRIEKWDAGLVAVPTASVTGRVWHDADYDGLQKRDAAGNWDASEPGLAGQKVTLTQWYYDGGAWQQNTAFGADRWTK